MQKNTFFLCSLLISINVQAQTLPETIHLEGQDKLSYHVIMDEVNSLTTKDGRKVEIPVIYDFHTILSDFAGDNAIAMEVLYQKVLLKGKENPEKDEEFQVKNIDALNGFKGEMQISKKGELIEYNRVSNIGADYEMVANVLENTAQQLFIELPNDDNVVIGTSWTDEFSVQNQVGTSTVNSNFNVRFKFEQIVDTLGITCAKVSFRTIGFETSVKDEMMEMFQTKVSNTGSGELVGYAYLNSDTNVLIGLFQKTEINTLVKIDKPNGSVDEINSEYFGKVEILLMN